LKSEGHKGAGMINLEHLLGHGIKHGWAERTPALAKFDLFVDAVGHAWNARAADDGATTKCAGAEFHTPLEPGDRVAIDHDFRDALFHIIDLLPHRRTGMARAGSNHVFVAVGRAEINVLHLLYRYATLMRDVRGGADRSPSITRGRLHEQFLHLWTSNDLLVELDVQRATAGKGNLAGLADDVAQVVVHHLQRQLLE